MGSFLGSEAITEAISGKLNGKCTARPHRVEMDSLLGRSAAASGARRRAR